MRNSEVVRRFSEEVRSRIVENIESGMMSQAEAAREYEVSKSAVRHWVREYGKFKPQKSVIEVVMKDERERISELEKALAEAHLKLRIYDKMIELADKGEKLNLKKSIGIELSKLSGKKNERG